MRSASAVTIPSMELIVSVEPTSPVAGWVTGPRGRSEFVGWLGLLAALSAEAGLAVDAPGGLRGEVRPVGDTELGEDM